MFFNPMRTVNNWVSSVYMSLHQVELGLLSSCITTVKTISGAVDLYLELAPRAIMYAMRLLTKLLNFEHLSDIITYDCPQYLLRFVFNYVLNCVYLANRLILRTAYASVQPVFSVIGFFSNAEWFEREFMEMFGLLLMGHPNGTKLLGDYNSETGQLRKGQHESNLKQEEQHDATFNGFLAHGIKDLTLGVVIFAFIFAYFVAVVYTKLRGEDVRFDYLNDFKSASIVLKRTVLTTIGLLLYYSSTALDFVSQYLGSGTSGFVYMLSIAFAFTFIYAYACTSWYHAWVHGAGRGWGQFAMMFALVFFALLLVYPVIVWVASGNTPDLFTMAFTASGVNKTLVHYGHIDVNVLVPYAILWVLTIYFGYIVVKDSVLSDRYGSRLSDTLFYCSYVYLTVICADRVLLAMRYYMLSTGHRPMALSLSCFVLFTICAILYFRSRLRYAALATFVQPYYVPSRRRVVAEVIYRVSLTYLAAYILLLSGLLYRVCDLCGFGGPLERHAFLNPIADPFYFTLAFILGFGFSWIVITRMFFGRFSAEVKNPTLQNKYGFVKSVFCNDQSKQIVILGLYFGVMFHYAFCRFTAFLASADQLAAATGGHTFTRVFWVFFTVACLYIVLKYVLLWDPITLRGFTIHPLIDFIIVYLVTCAILGNWLAFIDWMYTPFEMCGYWRKYTFHPLFFPIIDALAYIIAAWITKGMFWDEATTFRTRSRSKENVDSQNIAKMILQNASVYIFIILALYFATKLEALMTLILKPIRYFAYMFYGIGNFVSSTKKTLLECSLSDLVAYNQTRVSDSLTKMIAWSNSPSGWAQRLLDTELFFVDGLTMWLVCLTLFLGFILLILARRENYTNKTKASARNLITIILAIAFLSCVCFATTDLLVFFIAFEASLIPLYFLVGGYGSRSEKNKASSVLVIFTLVGSAFLWVGILYCVVFLHTTNFSGLLSVLADESLANTRLFLFITFFMGFAFKVPVFMAHVWLTIAHVEAPTVGSIILAGLVLKLGGYGLLRWVILLLPVETMYYGLPVSWVCLSGYVIATLFAAQQTDLKRFIAYTSISHMNFGTAVLFSHTDIGITSYVHTMVSHGIIASGLFMLVGFIYGQVGRRDTISVSNLATLTPVWAIFWFLFSVANAGIPMFSAFPGEFFGLLSLFQTGGLTYAPLIFVGFFVTAVYAFVNLIRILYGALPEKSALIGKVRDLPEIVFTLAAALIGWSVVLGMCPDVLFRTANSTLPARGFEFAFWKEFNRDLYNSRHLDKITPFVSHPLLERGELNSRLYGNEQACDHALAYRIYTHKLVAQQTMIKGAYAKTMASNSIVHSFVTDMRYAAYLTQFDHKTVDGIALNVYQAAVTAKQRPEITWRDRLLLRRLSGVMFQFSRLGQAPWADANKPCGLTNIRFCAAYAQRKDVKYMNPELRRTIETEFAILNGIWGKDGFFSTQVGATELSRRLRVYATPDVCMLDRRVIRSKLKRLIREARSTATHRYNNGVKLAKRPLYGRLNRYERFRFANQDMLGRFPVVDNVALARHLTFYKTTNYINEQTQKPQSDINHPFYWMLCLFMVEQTGKQVDANWHGLGLRKRWNLWNRDLIIEARRARYKFPFHRNLPVTYDEFIPFSPIFSDNIRDPYIVTGEDVLSMYDRVSQFAVDTLFPGSKIAKKVFKQEHPHFWRDVKAKSKISGKRLHIRRNVIKNYVGIGGKAPLIISQGPVVKPILGPVSTLNVKGRYADSKREVMLKNLMKRRKENEMYHAYSPWGVKRSAANQKWSVGVDFDAYDEKKQLRGAPREYKRYKK